MRLSIVIPTTVERPVGRVGQSARLQLNRGDELHLVFDKDKLGHYGHPLRNKVIDGIEHGYIATIDDDDEYLPGALNLMRSMIDTHPGKWFVFQMVGGEGSHYPGLVVPTMGHKVLKGNVGTPMLLWPAAAKARFGHSYTGDYEMALALWKELGEPIWVDQTVAIIRP